MNRGGTLPALAPPRQGKRQHDAHDEHEQREDQVFVVKTLPLDVLELGIDKDANGDNGPEAQE